MEQWHRIGDPEINPHRYSHLIFDLIVRKEKKMHWKKNSLVNKQCQEAGFPHGEERN